MRKWVSSKHAFLVAVKIYGLYQMMAHNKPRKWIHSSKGQLNKTSAGRQMAISFPQLSERFFFFLIYRLFAVREEICELLACVSRRRVLGTPARPASSLMRNCAQLVQKAAASNQYYIHTGRPAINLGGFSIKMPEPLMFKSRRALKRWRRAAATTAAAALSFPFLYRNYGRGKVFRLASIVGALFRF